MLRDGVEVVIRPKAFETLLCLLERHSHLITRSELMDRVWPDTFVSESVLDHCISEIRKALGDDPRNPRYLKTIPRVGYKFMNAVEEVIPTGPETRSAAKVPPAWSIAVLPFANISTEPNNEFFCDGLSEELINGFTKVSAMRVVAHSSSFAFKGRNLDVREIGRQLNVAAILEGSVRRAGNRLRISAQLIDTAEGFHLWSDQYDRPLEDVFAIQDEISAVILDTLKVEWLSQKGKDSARRPTGNMEAYELYLRGRSFWHRRYQGFMQKAMECFEQAIRKDSHFALAFTGLADTYSLLGVWGWSPPKEVFPKAASLVQGALDIDDKLAEAHASQGFIHTFYDWNWELADKELQRAIDLNPGCALNHLWNAHYLSIIGRMDEAIAEVRKAHSLDPMSPVVAANVGWTLFLASENDRAVGELQKALELDPHNAMAHFYLGYPFADSGKFGEAIEMFQEAMRLTGGMPWSAESLGWVYGLAGKRAKAKVILSEAQLRVERKQYVPSSAFALIHLGLGNTDEFFRCLARAFDERDAFLVWLKSSPTFKPLHSDPRFSNLMLNLGLK
ncbi:MAG: winged helix-turn-helix domain-containing protein [Deltaproteobacteria bacterium]|nr:winged helix-turn-helix domain-containing protein [Deltaproteobacteria bacterium]